MQFKRFCSYVVVINDYRLCILPFFLAHQEIPGLDIIVDPCAAIIVLFVTGLLCVGIKEVSICSFQLYLYFSYHFFLYIFLYWFSNMSHLMRCQFYPHFSHQLILYHYNLVRVLWLLVGKTLLMLALWNKLSLAKKGGAASYPFIKRVQGIVQPLYLVI